MRFPRVAPYLLAAALLILPALAAGASAAPAAQQGPSTVNVAAVDFTFQPQTITINAGDTIVWTNNDSVAHTVTASDGSFDSGLFGAGETYSRTFDTPGTIPYYCIPHGTPQGGGMAGTIVVQAAAAGAPQPAQPEQPMQPAQPEPTQPAEPAGDVTPSVQVEDQPVVDGSIVVPLVVAAQDGWIVIHTNTPENRPGPVIGHAMVMEGENEDVRVTLSSTPVAGDMLWPMLHVDAGQIGVYEFPGADTPVQVDGQVVMERMTVLEGPAAAAPAQAPSATAPEQRPAALPSTGEGDIASTWLMVIGVAAGFLLSGLALRLATSKSRR